MMNMSLRYLKVAPLRFVLFVVAVTVYIVLLVLALNRRNSAKPQTKLPEPPLHESPALHIDGLKWIAKEWRNHVPNPPNAYRSKLRFVEPNFSKFAVSRDARDEDKESSVSGDSATYDQSSAAVFSHPFANQGQNVRRIYPKNRDHSNTVFKPVIQYAKPRYADDNNKPPPTSRDVQLVNSGLNRLQADVAGRADRTTCKPHTNVVYVKTHKTGSSTLQNIIYRFGDERNLTFALPTRGVYIQSVREFQPSSILPIPPGGQYNIMANHVRFFDTGIRTLMPADSKFITIIRQSSDQFRSMFAFYTMDAQYKASVEQYSLNPEYFYQKFGHQRYTRHSGRDPMLFDLGMDKGQSFSEVNVQEYIKFLDSRFHLVLITEYFYESLILLKDMLCLDMRTLVHVNNKMKVSLAPEVTTLSVEDARAGQDVAKRLNRWNTGDVKLYEHFNRTLWQKIEAYGRAKMAGEVQELKALCRRFESECMNGTKVRDISRGSLRETGLAEYVVKPTQLKNATCRRLAMVPKTYLSHLRNKHVEHFKRRS